jgi:hypothetical protein
LPVPAAPALIVIHESLLVAVQAQPAAVVTATVPVAADAELKFAVVGEMLNVHGGTPGWVTVNVWPPIVIVPVREVVSWLAATA